MECFKAVVLKTDFEQPSQEILGHSGATISVMTFHLGPPCGCRFRTFCRVWSCPASEVWLTYTHFSLTWVLPDKERIK